MRVKAGPRKKRRGKDFQANLIRSGMDIDIRFIFTFRMDGRPLPLEG
jgi:hypothetical protein